MSGVIANPVSFCGSIAFGVPDGLLDGVGLVVLDGDGLAAGLPLPTASTATTQVAALERRPQRATVEALASALRVASGRGVLAAGSGATLDAAKQAALAAQGRPGEPLELTFVPCGPEPYRAFARFSVVDDGPERPTVVDERFGGARVLIVVEALAALGAEVVAAFALDTLVHALETLVNAAPYPLARAQAEAAIRTIARAAGAALDPTGAARGHARAELVCAALLALEGFMTTRLGIAHAIASPLGTRCAITHDTINGLLGAQVAQLWRDEPAIELAAEALGTVGADGVAAALDRLRRLAGLPSSLAGLGVSPADIAAVLPQSAKSSGIAFLPRLVSADQLRELAHAAWRGPGNDDEGA